MAANVNNPTCQTSSIINENYKKYIYEGLSTATLSAISLLFPFEALKIVGTTMLAGMGYGIVSNLVSSIRCPEYFTIDHKYHGKELQPRLVRSLNPLLNAVVWGSLTTMRVSFLAGTFFALLSRIPFAKLAIKISAAQLGFCFGAIAVVAILYSQIKSKHAQNEMKDEMTKKPYIAYEDVPVDLQHKWEGCYVRNKSGNNVLRLGSLLTSIGIIAVRAGIIIL
ncbi:MAG: hypothetical protein WCT85_05915 [Parachlamydiales bacterium]|jgi:hypothetical protein